VSIWPTTSTLAWLSSGSGQKFVPRNRRLANPRALQDTPGLAYIASTGTFGKVVLGSQGGHLLGDGHGDVFPVHLGIHWISLGIVVTLQFAEFELETGARQVMRGATEVHLSPKAFELLLLLIERRPNAISKRELHDVLWPSTFVAGSNLAALVNEVRTALEDDAQRPRFVRTVPRFGYAFCGAVTEGRAARAGGDGLSCWLILDDRCIELADGENLVGRDPHARAALPSVTAPQNA
jgi:DNA-binding winged helix-turn-helix (wHTH) protein